MNPGNRVMIAMSGGVDSSVAAYLMKQNGFDCVGATLKLYSNEDIQLDRNKTCCSLSDVEDARSVATRLGIPYFVFNFSDNFKEKVIDHFISTYRNGGTPNPCIDCNRYIKFDKLLTRAELMECDHVVTGHYARVELDEGSGRYLLKRAADTHKDQTYVLWPLRQDQLAHTFFPLGNLTKPEVRRIAEEQNFLNAEKPDSQDICFVPDGNYARFIEEYTGEKSPSGDFISDGRKVGTHKGIIHYTLGQRKKLGVSVGHTIFVTGIDPVKNIVTLGDEADLFKSSLIAHDINMIAYEKLEKPLRVTAKVRYSHKEAPATLTQLDDDSIRLDFDLPQRAITRGQSVVVYDGDTVVCGGIIDEVL